MNVLEKILEEIKEMRDIMKSTVAVKKQRWIKELN